MCKDDPNCGTLRFGTLKQSSKFIPASLVTFHAKSLSV